MRLGRFFPFDWRDVVRRALILCSATIEASIFVSQAVWLFRTRQIRWRAKEAGLEWDEFPEAQAWQEDRWRLSWSLSLKGSDGSVIKEKMEADVAGEARVSIEESRKVPKQSGDIEQCRQ